MDRTRTAPPDAAPSASTPKRAIRKALALWGALLAGHVAGGLFACMRWELPFAFGGRLVDNVLALLLLPLSAVVVAAIGPLFVVGFVLLSFRVEGGTKTAIGTLALGVPLLSIALILGLLRWWKTENPRVRLCGWLALAGYGALSTFCGMYLDTRI